MDFRMLRAIWPRLIISRHGKVSLLAFTQPQSTSRHVLCSGLISFYHRM